MYLNGEDVDGSKSKERREEQNVIVLKIRLNRDEQK
jgi:hypothetical protein